MPKIAHFNSEISHSNFPILITLALWEMPLSLARLFDFIQTSIAASRFKNNFTTTCVKVSVAELATQGCISFEAGFGYQCSPEVAHAVFLHLHENHELTEWVIEIQAFLDKNREYSAWSKPSSEFCQREMLFSALCADLPRFGQWRSLFFAFPNKFDDLPAQKLFATSAGPILFTEFTSNIQALLLFDLFSAANWMLEDCTLAYRYAINNVEHKFYSDVMLIDTLCKQVLLRGEPESMLNELLRHLHQQGHITAIRQLMQGDYAASIKSFSSTHSDRKLKAGKRKLFIPDLPGLFYTVTHFSNKSPEHLKLLKDQIEEGCKLKQTQFYNAARPLIEHLIKGTPVSAKTGPAYVQSLDDVFARLAYVWQDCPASDADVRHLKLLFNLTQQRGYHWVAAEIDQMRHEQLDTPYEYADWHTRRKLKPLYLALPKEQPWERALAALAQLKPGSPGSGSDSRIAWFIECESHYVNLEPREQKCSAKGVWSKGRAIALKRLSYEQESFPGILEQDKKIASCIRKSYDNYYGGSDYEINGEKALPFLIGHPAVFWIDAPDILIDVVKGEAALTMQQQGDKIHLQLDPSMNEDDAVVWRKQTPTRLVIYPSSPEIKQIASILGKGLSIPENAKKQLVAVIAAIAPHLAIHSDLPELAQHIAKIDVNTTLYAHLLPLKDGLRIQFLVRPIPDGSWFSPAKGSVNVIGEYQGKAVQTRRHLQQEQEQLDALMASCPSLALAEQNAQEWEFGHPETCLEILSELNNFQALPNNNLELVWPEGERFRIKSTRQLSQLNLSIKKQGEWFVAGGEIQLDDGKIIALRELLKLVNGATGRFIPLGENNFLALTDSFKKRLQELNAFSEISKDGVRINHLAAPMLADFAAEVGDLHADAAWKAHVTKLDNLSNFVPQLPSTLQATLRDYQLEGFQWLSRLAHWGVGACLADDMGLGKTVQTLAVLLERAAGGPALVVAPISVAMNWQSEVARFAPTLRIRAYHQQRELTDLAGFDLVIASYGMLQSDAEQFAAQHWHTVILDEAQVIKNPSTKRSQAAMALTADFRIIASGTPVENHLGELWNLFRFINPGLLGSRERFAERFSNPIERGDKQARLHLKRLIQPFILRRTKAQVLSELPARTEIVLQVELSEQERHLYEALRQEALDKIARMKPDEGKAMQVLAEITKLRRFCCNPKLVIKNSEIAGSKLAVFAEVTEELLDNKHKALVFSQFVDHLEIVRAWLEQKGISYQYLDGSTPPLERKKRVDAFQAGTGDIFLISLKAGGTGLNLTAADYVIHLDPWWNPAVEDQASDRAHRMGQLRPVTIYRLVVQQTIEEQIIALHAQKRDLADSLLEGGDVSAKLDTTALLRLLKEGM